ncbi:MAG: sodium:solute symporter, partial [Myxococcota bacterium]
MFDLHPIGVAIALYLVGMIAIAWWANGRVESVEDFVLAGRTLGLRIITSSLLATWVGAGTLLVAADEIHHVGLSVIALDPIGSGAALLVGALMAPKIRSFQVVTLPDLFRKMYGPRAEGLLAAVMIPADILWVAVQYMALGSIIELYFSIPLEYAIPVVAMVGLAKTLIGGMHSIAMTDTVQLGAIVSGMGVLALSCLVAVGRGWPMQGFWALGDLEPS